MRPRDYELARGLLAKLEAYERANGTLSGIESDAARAAFLEQVLESLHRIEYVRRLRERKLSPSRKDPSSDLYDPIKAAVIFDNEGEFDEACWQVFLAVHFGKHLKGGWRLPRDIYGRLGNGKPWSWKETSKNLEEFKIWLDRSIPQLKSGDAIRCFSNHRKYLSLSAYSANGTGAAVQSYVEWVLLNGGHRELFQSALISAEHDSRVAFAILYESMDAVRSFGRIGRFDYLTMIGKLELAHIEPNIAYIKSSTGPKAGAALMFDEMSGSKLETLTLQLGESLDLNMQVMEDALCNWQKSPHSFKPFRG